MNKDESGIYTFTYDGKKVVVVAGDKEHALHSFREIHKEYFPQTPAAGWTLAFTKD